MRAKLKYLFLFLAVNCSSQTIDLSLSKTACTLYAGNIYAFGIRAENKASKLLIYKFGIDLNLKDSMVVDLGKAKPNDYLQLSADTLHDYLNIYLQRNEKKLVQIVRLNKQFRQVAIIENVDVARLNSISAFENEIFYYNKDVYSVKVSVSDTSGRQFYLNKFSMKSDLKNFEYDFKWQFPFERKNINSAHIIMVTNRYVALYVNVIECPKSGQWILKVNTESGKLIHGTRIGSKGDAAFYSFGCAYNDAKEGAIYLLGQKFAANDFSQKENKINIAGKTVVDLYLARVDSASEIVSREEFKVPVVEQKGNKGSNAYILRPTKLVKNDNQLNFETDIYKGNYPGCFIYCNTTNNSITLDVDKSVIDKSAVITNTLIEKFYNTTDKTDMNGKLCLDSLQEFEKIYYRFIPFEVKLAFKTDESGNPEWLLHKSDAKKGVESFALLKQDKKIYQLQNIADIAKAENPKVIIVSRSSYLVGRQVAEDKFQLNLFTW